jgi:hypothetical protein
MEKRENSLILKTNDTYPTDFNALYLIVAD